MSDTLLQGITDEQAWDFFRQSVQAPFLAMLDELLTKGRSPKWILQQNVSISLSPVEEALMSKAMRFRHRQLKGGDE